MSLPRHIAVIMDGNGRWAKKRLLPRLAGHRAGADTLDRVMHYCRDAGVEYLTVYAFSTENWKRSTEEVGGIMRLLGRYLDKVRYGDGLVDFPGHLRALKRDDYQGFITVEGWRSTESQLEGAVSALRYFREMEQSL